MVNKSNYKKKSTSKTISKPKTVGKASRIALKPKAEANKQLKKNKNNQREIVVNSKFPLLDSILESHLDIKKLSLPDLKKLALEVRKRINEVVRENGGHLGPNLGVVEITIACHSVFDLKKHRLFFDVGHQAYPHKILTQRHKNFFTLRKKKGVSGYPHQQESAYDTMRGGHASTAISSALGMKKGLSLNKENDLKAIAIVGDGSMTGGMAFEGLNHSGHLKENLIIILNDNSFSISPTVGGLANTLNDFRHGDTYLNFKKNLLQNINKIPGIGRKIENLINTALSEMKKFSTPSQIFTVLGFDYIGPINGNDINEVKKALQQAKKQSGPVLIHALTEKGVGYNPDGMNKEVIIGPHALSPGQRQKEENLKKNLPPAVKRKTYSDVFSESLIELAKRNEKIVAITAAMSEGTGLNKFAKVIPDRYFDVGICEAHATGFSAGLNLSGNRPVFAVYSTFLQRAFDQIFHEIILQQNISVIFAIDRAGLVGDDGPSHHGVYDIAYLRIFPNFVLMAPKDGEELKDMLAFALTLKNPVGIRYPRDFVPDLMPSSVDGEGVKKKKNKTARNKISLGKGEFIKKGNKVCCLAYGSMVEITRQAITDVESDTESKLDSQPVKDQVALYNLRFAKPIDKKSILNILEKYDDVLVLEEGIKHGGLGTAILEIANEAETKEAQTQAKKKNAAKKAGQAKIHLLGIPDKLIEHASRLEQLAECGLGRKEIANTIKKLL